MDGVPRILIVGGGYGGMHTALRLERLLRPGEVASLDVLEHPRQGFWPALRVIATGPSQMTPFPGHQTERS